MKIKFIQKLLTLTATIVFGALSSTAIAHGNDQRVERLIDRLELTDIQAEKFRVVRQEMSQQSIELQEQQESLNELVDNGELEAAKILASKLGVARVELRIARKSQLSEILTPEQLEEMSDLKKRNCRGNRRGKEGVLTR